MKKTVVPGTKKANRLSSNRGQWMKTLKSANIDLNNRVLELEDNLSKTVRENAVLKADRDAANARATALMGKVDDLTDLVIDVRRSKQA